MSSHKSDKYMSYCEFHHDYQAIFISLDIEHVMLVTNVVCSGEINLDIRQTLPFRFFSNIVPALKSYLRISMSFRTIELN